MKRDANWFHRFDYSGELPSTALPMLPVIEIAGDRRVLIENHLSVTEYGRESICVKVRYGFVRITGKTLELAQMIRGQLVITGQIDSVSLVRRNCR